MGMRDDRVIRCVIEPVRYRVHHVNDGSKLAGKPVGSAHRAARLTIVEWWSQSEMDVLYLASGAQTSHLSPVTTWEPTLLPEDEPPIPVPSNYRWECEVPEGVIKMPLIEIMGMPANDRYNCYP